MGLSDRGRRLWYPSVVDGIVYVGDTSGTFYALRSSGAKVWTANVGGPITDSALVTNQMVIFGDLAGYIHGLTLDGSKVWSVRPNPDLTAAIFGSPILVSDLVGNHVVIGISSNERPGKDSFRGSVVRLDPDTGNIVWQTYVINDKGASGASIWSTPTYDAETDIVFVTTGNNYTEPPPRKPPTETGDAFIALNAATGEIVWKKQIVHHDVAGSIEADIGDSPQVYRLPSGRKSSVRARKRSASTRCSTPKMAMCCSRSEWFPIAPIR
jgi:polyvinyl alcohol dehydrogenase (cytochrome)